MVLQSVEPGGSVDGYDPDASDEEDIPTIDASSMPFRFNPPAHPATRFIRSDFGSKGSTLYNPYSDEDNSKNEFGAGSRKKADKGGASVFEGLRLGRIVQGDIALSAAMIDANQRYGLRFHYNPSDISGGLNVGTDFIPSQQTTGAFVLQRGLENISFKILINRIPDVQTGAKATDYTPNISAEDRAQIQERGTHYDIDFLYRCANGVHSTRSRSNTGDIGVLLPNPCHLVLGPFTSLGAVTSVAVEDKMFSRDMVPILSEVTVVFTRFLATTPADTERLGTYGITEDGSGANDSSSGGEGSDTPSPSSLALTGIKIFHLAQNAGFVSGEDADIMTQIAWKESSWVPTKVNNNPRTQDLSYGLWQINMFGNNGPGRRRLYNIKNDSDLLDPVFNSRVAYYIWRDSGYGERGFRNWSTYKNGSYKEVEKTWRR